MRKLNLFLATIVILTSYFILPAQKVQSGIADGSCPSWTINLYYGNEEGKPKQLEPKTVKYGNQTLDKTYVVVGEQTKTTAQTIYIVTADDPDCADYKFQVKSTQINQEGKDVNSWDILSGEQGKVEGGSSRGLPGQYIKYFTLNYGQGNLGNVYRFDFSVISPESDKRKGSRYVCYANDANKCEAVSKESSGGGGASDGSSGSDNSGPKDEKLNVDTDVSIAGLKDYDEVVGTVFNPLNFNRPEGLLVWLINALLFVVGSLSVLFIIIGGIRMSTAAGNQSTFTKGKNTIQWAVVGLILSVLSFSIVAIIQSILT